MNDYFEEMWTGPGHLRFFLQPLIAITLGIRDGINDAKQGKDPYLLSLVRDREHRSVNVGAMLKRLAVPLVLGTVLSAVFQFVIRGHVLLLTALAYGLSFVAIPYIVARAATNRLWRARHDSPAH